VDDEGADGLDDIVLLDCPACDEEEQRVLRAARSGWTLQCTSCQAIRTVPAPPEERSIEVAGIVSEGPAARSVRLHVPLDGQIKVGDEVELEGHTLKVTGIEASDGTRPDKALGRDVRVLHAKAFDTVRIPYSVNQGEFTKSFQEDIDPDTVIEVGEVREVQGVRLLVKTLKSDQNRTIHHGFLLARNVRRVFADVAPKDAKPGQRRKTRARGADPRTKGKRGGARTGARIRNRSPGPQPRRSRRA
jgi:uncharacterized Zn finger protein